MARLVLHIGTHKTATTTIQDTFHANRDLLVQHGVIYPALGNHSGHHGLLTDWIALPLAYDLPDGGIGTLQALAAEYVDSDVTLLLSSEEFSRGGGAGGQVDMAALAGVFDGFESISLICFLREQWQFLQSVYLEVARSRIPPRPPVLIEQAFQTGMVDGLWCDYLALYDHLKSGFHPKDIYFVDFNTARAAPDGVLGVMLSFLDLPFGVEALTMVNNGVSNISPRPLPTWAGLAIAGGNPADDNLFSAVQEAFDLEFGPTVESCLFTRSEIAALTEHFQTLNSTLVEHHQQFQPGFEMSVTDRQDTLLYREDITTPFWVRAARRIYLSGKAGTG